MHLSATLYKDVPTVTNHMMRDARYRHWLLTYNNPTESAEELIQLFDENGIQYTFQLESGESNTRHYQIYLRFNNPQRSSRLAGLLPRAHYEAARHPDSAELYCRKSESRIDGPWTNIRPGGTKRKSEYNDLLKTIQTTQKSTAELATEYFPLFCRNYSNIRRTISIIRPVEPRSWKTHVEWHWGKTGTGKSRYAYDTTVNKSVYWKNSTEWWDHYEGQEYVVIDDFRGEWPLKFLLNLFDRYPMKVQCKGYTAEFVSKTIIVTANYEPSHWYYFDEEGLRALLRRIDFIKEYK
ncbi:Rep [Bat circovirus]|nr:Rep [Bat circovirus]